MTAMAPYLELNPRKIKRFINVYRLQAFIAWRRNLLQFEDATALAAAVVIAIRWPSAVGQTLDDPALLGAIKRAGAAQREHAREQLAGRLSAQDEEEYQRLIATYGAAVKMLCGIEDFIRLLNGLDDMELTKVRTFLRLTQLATPIAPEVGEHQTAPAARRTRRRPSERSSGSVVASSADGARARPEATGDQPSAAHLAGEPPPAGEETATTEATPTESEASAETPPVTSPTAASPSATSTESAVPTGPRRRRGSAHG
jgi:hypothetical protein